MGVGSAILAPLTKTIAAIVLFSFVYDLFNPIADGVRMNIMGYESFGYAWYVWILCQLLDDFAIGFIDKTIMCVFFGLLILCITLRIILT
jgi:hypothetical protein